MPRRALIEHRPWLVASIAASLAYFVLSDEAVPGLFLALLKMVPVLMLAIYAIRRASGGDAKLIAGALAMGAIGDFAIEFDLIFGAVAFSIGHLLAIILFLGHRPDMPSGFMRVVALALVLVPPAIATLLAFPLDNWAGASAYALVVGAMAAMAVTSSFPVHRVGLGAALFVLSDLLIIAREADVLGEGVTSWLVWPLYYAAQFLIATGVVQTLRGREECATGEP